jgi:hypothetical protein
MVKESASSLFAQSALYVVGSSTAFPHECRKSHHNAFLSQGIFYLGCGVGRPGVGPNNIRFAVGRRKQKLTGRATLQMYFWLGRFFGQLVDRIGRLRQTAL